MFDGSTGGRAFESEWSHYLWGGLFVLAMIGWYWFQRDLKRHALKIHAKDPSDTGPVRLNVRATALSSGQVSAPQATHPNH